MKIANLGQIVADAFEHVLQTTEDPFRSFSFYDLWTGHHTPYRAYLDRQIVNGFGNVVPRIETVKNNLRRLGPTRLDPRRLR